MGTGRAPHHTHARTHTHHPTHHHHPAPPTPRHAPGAMHMAAGGQPPWPNTTRTPPRAHQSKPTAAPKHHIATLYTLGTRRNGKAVAPMWAHLIGHPRTQRVCATPRHTARLTMAAHARTHAHTRTHADTTTHAHTNPGTLRAPNKSAWPFVGVWGSWHTAARLHDDMPRWPRSLAVQLPRARCARAVQWDARPSPDAIMRYGAHPP